MGSQHHADTSPIHSQKAAVVESHFDSAKRFRGTNIDELRSLRANHKLPLTPPDGDFEEDSDPDEPPPDSAGPVFTPPVQAYDWFVDAVRTHEERPINTPLGIENWGNQCYRNAVLTMLINSYPLMSYARAHLSWDLPFALAQTPVSKILHALEIFSQHNEAPENVTQRRSREQYLNADVRKFWEQVCYPSLPPTRGSFELPPIGPWQQNLSVDEVTGELKTGFEQEDASEFLNWLLTIIEGELARNHDFKDFRVHRALTSAQQNFDWLTTITRAYRFDCPKCQWRVQRRLGIVKDKILTLNIPKIDATLTKMLATTHQSVRLEDCISANLHEKVDARCPRCKNDVSSAIKRARFQQTPEILFLTISRFVGRFEPLLDADDEIILDKDGRPLQNFVAEKDFRAVIIPQELDLSPWLNHHQYGPGSQVRYRLAGVVSHCGRGIENGHYQSFVRGRANRAEWFRINDQVVHNCMPHEFDDTKVDPLDQESFENRFTPYIIMYEKDYENEVVMPGFHTINVDEGDDADVRPTHWSGRTPMHVAPPEEIVETNKNNDGDDDDDSDAGNEQPAEDANADDESAEDNKSSTGSSFPDYCYELFPEDIEWPEAQVDVTIEISGAKVQFPTHYIKHFCKAKARSVKIRAGLTVPKGKAKRVYEQPDKVQWTRLDLAEAHVDGELLARETVKKKLLLADTRNDDDDIEAQIKVDRRKHGNKKLRHVRSCQKRVELLKRKAKSNADDRKETTKKQKPWSQRWKDVRSDSLVDGDENDVL